MDIDDVVSQEELFEGSPTQDDDKDRTRRFRWEQWRRSGVWRWKCQWHADHERSLSTLRAKHEKDEQLGRQNRYAECDITAAGLWFMKGR